MEFQAEVEKGKSKDAGENFLFLTLVGDNGGVGRDDWKEKGHLCVVPVYLTISNPWPDPASPLRLELSYLGAVST